MFITLFPFWDPFQPSLKSLSLTGRTFVAFIHNSQKTQTWPYFCWLHSAAFKPYDSLICFLVNRVTVKLHQNMYIYNVTIAYLILWTCTETLPWKEYCISSRSVVRLSRIPCSFTN